ncbi:dienelactone hydrolase family protein [Sphingomonas sp. 1P06PA]|uniref:dienelactone hydrolase family protein n=1 Tax=Sphingomonas sp. 1P06PA TaxID=554121 RepID=UPI0039A5FEDB
MGRLMRIEALDGSAQFDAYCATPDGTPRGAIVVIQEIFGINAGVRARCDRWAANGYLAVAPDLFWRFAPGVDLDPDRPEDFKQALQLLQQFETDPAVADIEAVIRVARKDSGGRVGVVGYCLGGKLAYLAATRTDTDASVGYYGGGIHEMLSESHAIARPLMLHFAEADHFIDAEARAAVHAALDGNGHVVIHEYPGVDHGFATETGKRRDEAAANLADERAAAFFAEHVG